MKSGAVSGSTWDALKFVYAFMSPARRRQFHAALGLMILGALAEMATIGAVLPFLALISGVRAVDSVPAIAAVFDLLGWQPGTDLIVPATLLLVAAVVGAAGVRLALLWVSQAFIFRLGHDIGLEIYSRTIRQPYSTFVRRNSSEVIAGVEKVQLAIFSVLLPLMQGAVAAVMAFFLVAVLIAIDPEVALGAALVMVAVYFGLSLATRRLLVRNSAIVNDLHTTRVRLIQEGLGGIRDILIDQSQAVFEENFRKLDDFLRRAQMINAFVAQAPRHVVEAVGVALIATLAVYMSGQPGGVVAAIPVLGALALGAQRLLPLLQLAYVGWSRFNGSMHAIIDMVRLMRIPTAMVAPYDRSVPVVPFRSTISFRHVGFSYEEGRRPALFDIELEVRKGERIGLVGETGSGKSTLLDLLMGLLEPTSGEILVDGEPLDHERRANWQRQIAHVPQTIFLADSSITANIAFGEPDDGIDMARVREAASRARIDTFVETLPSGYATTVGERGVRLSGGQRQRIGIARALYKRASVLILDEATSALDDRTEAAVLEALSRGDEGLTIFMIAHRVGSLAGCDRLVRLEAGRIVEMGRGVGTIGHSARAAPGQ